jgi:glycogen operon protein
MTGEDWGSGFAKSVTAYLNGQGIPDRDARGQRVTDDSFVLCFNAHFEPIEFFMPPTEFGSKWQTVLRTDGADETTVAAATALTVEARTVIVLQAVDKPA